MTLDQLKTRVKIKVDEYTPSGVSHSFDDFLEPMLQESAKEITDTAPRQLLSSTDISTSVITYENDLAYLYIPADYARLCDIKFPLWDKPVYDTISPDDPEHAIQDNEYLKAGYGRPVVMLKTVGTAGKRLVCGKVASGATPTYARYFAYEEPADMPSALDEALTWLAAAKILQILNYQEQAQLAQERYIAEIRNRTR